MAPFWNEGVYRSAEVITNRISPASIYGSRVATREMESGQETFIANDSSVSYVVVPPQKTPEIDEAAKTIMPAMLPSLSATELHSENKSEIQDIQLDPSGTTLGTADSRGNAVITSLNDSRTGEAKRIKYEATPVALENPNKVEHGWSGLTFVASSPQQVVVANFQGSKFIHYDAATVLREMPTVFGPTQIQTLDENTIAMAESHQISVWDLRKLHQGPVHRCQPGTTTIYAMDHNDNFLVVGGEDRSVHIFDIRKWGIQKRFAQVLKYEITSLNYTSSHHLSIGGMDNEIVTVDTQGNSQSVATVRGTGRWIGVQKDKSRTDGSTLTAVCDTGDLYVLRSSSTTP